jgi:hypothetical protein
MREKQQMQQFIILSIMFSSSYMFRQYITIFMELSYCLLRDAELRSSRQNIVDGRVVSSDVMRGDLRLGALPEDDNDMPKHVGATMHN